MNKVNVNMSAFDNTEKSINTLAISTQLSHGKTFYKIEGQDGLSYCMIAHADTIEKALEILHQKAKQLLQEQTEEFEARSNY